MVPRPEVSLAEAAAVAREQYGLEGSLQGLPGEKDRNFRLETPDGRAFVLKVGASDESRERLRLQTQAMRHVHERDAALAIPAPCANGAGDDLAEVELRGSAHPVRVLTWLDGVRLARFRPHGSALDRELGRFLGRLSVAMQDLQSVPLPTAPRWSLDLGSESLLLARSDLEDGTRRALWVHTLERWCAGLVVSDLPRQVVHHDANDHNVLVDPRPGPPRISGLIDFGDLVEGPRVAEAAVACAYAMLDRADPVAVAADLVAGFHAEQPLDATELEAVVPLAVLRLGQSVRNAAVQRRADPDNEYLSISEAPVWRLLERLEGVSPRWATFRVRHACGLPGTPDLPGLHEWMERTTFAPVLSASLSTPAVLDLGVGSAWLAERGDPEDMEVLAREIAAERSRHGAQVAIGGYGEARLLYTSPGFADEAAGESRTVHLGVDLWVEAGTPVQAPYPGTVLSVQDNEAPLDYGPTVILEHEGPEGIPFFTLYGHLARTALAELSVGQEVRAGETIATVGAIHENGGWPPHLHFQVVTDLLDRSGDFPGVAAASDHEAWLELCPDPNRILKVPGLKRTGYQDLVRRRRVHLGPNLSLSYREPLHMVKGRGSYLFDATGRRFLDAVNNVSHVGHCHPRVIQAARRQMALLNTNTRYLSEVRLRYVERLCALFPEHLSVCYLVCSGSEANELALRLARAHTGRRDVLVQAAGYHGNSSTLVDVSPYKHAGPGGAGAPDWVHTLALPDPYRGLHRGRDSGPAYVADLRQLLSQGLAPAAFLAEALPGCGGQIVPPPGYLAAAFDAVRQAGGVCIADEVQTGFGRVGPDIWAFARQGASPDLVTLGKPVGNGHPMGAVITTPEIAASFDNGMEYFNTFGGNPVSCAVGLAVLDVLRDDDLPAHAGRVGEWLRESLTALAQDHPLLGDVRGQGLFLGVELVTDREARTPAPEHAAHVVDRMKECGILMSVDGPDENVLKIKPPLVFSQADAERLVRTLDGVLSETASKEWS